MRILVTGAAGFLGYCVAVRLKDAGHDLVLADDFSRGQQDAAYVSLCAAASVSAHAVDLLQAESWDVLDGEFDAVLHMAAINGTRHFYERPYEVLDTNLHLVQNLLLWHGARSPRAKIVFTSSSEVYAGVDGVPVPTPEDVPVGFEDIQNPRYSYAASKIAGELLIRHYGESTGVSFAIVRPHNIYGPRMGFDHVIPQFITRLARRDDPFRILGGDQSRAFCYVDDFTGGLTAALESDRADGEIVNLGDDRVETRIVDLADLLFAIAGHHPAVELKEAPPGSVRRRCPDLSKARALLGYRPVVPLEEGLRHTWKWYSAELGAPGTFR